MNRKTLIILLLTLLLVIVLFAVSILLGAREPGSGLKLDLNSPSLAGIASWISRPAKAEYLSLRSGNATDCRLENNRITIKAGAVCVYTVAPDKLWTRKLRLKLPASQDSGGQVIVLLVQQDSLGVRQILDPGKTSNPLDIYGRQKQEPATIMISAVGDQEKYLIEIVEE